MNKTIYSGYTREVRGNVTKYYVHTYYWTDDRDNLPPNLIDYNAVFVTNFSGTDLMRSALKKEKEGHKINVQLGDQFFYETPEE